MPASLPADIPPPHGYAHAVPVDGSPHPAHAIFVLTQDEVYVPIVVRRPSGEGPFPVITMGRGDGRGGLPHLLREVARLAPMQDLMIARGYAVACVNYRNEVPRLYGRQGPAVNLADDISGGEGLTLKSAATLDSDDLAAVWRYLAAQPWVRPEAIGAIGVSHGGEMILKALAAGATIACGVIAEGASHEFLSVDTTASAPRLDGELQYHDIEVVRRHASREQAMARLEHIRTPLLHLGREGDHLQGIFQLVHEWMLDAGGPSRWACHAHPDHGYAFLYPGADGRLHPDPVQQAAFDAWMGFFDEHLRAG
jgi:dienelactone hydrolase